MDKDVLYGIVFWMEMFYSIGVATAGLTIDTTSAIACMVLVSAVVCATLQAAKSYRPTKSFQSIEINYSRMRRERAIYSIGIAAFSILFISFGLTKMILNISITDVRALVGLVGLYLFPIFFCFTLQAVDAMIKEEGEKAQ